jgi:aspartyl-tRNA(Asn)/glutamyl-tRNA(Gln) amidotransferase subunit A
MISSPTLDVAGPMARTVRDAARLFDAIAGHDPADPSTGTRPAPDTEARLDRTLHAPSVAVPPDALLDGVTPAVRGAIAAAVHTLRGLGWTVVARPLPDLDALNAVTALVFLAEVAARHRERLRDHAGDYHPEVRDRVLPGFAVEPAAHRRALAARGAACAAFCRSAFDGADLLLLPSAPDVAPRFADVFPDGAGQEEAKAVAIRSLATAADPGRFTRAINYLGLPALALPVGLSPDGLPVGIQLVGRPFDEATLLAAGHRFEDATGFARLRPSPGTDPV